MKPVLFPVAPTRQSSEILRPVPLFEVVLAADRPEFADLTGRRIIPEGMSQPLQSPRES